MKISACVIVKNEAENLPQWLHCMKLFTQEQIVVDTGSEDNTIEIAEKAGAKVSSFPWRNDFAAAKNYALEQASGDWIAFLDADEYIRDEDIPALEIAIHQKDKDKNVAGILLQLINIDKDTGENQGTSFFQIRLFRNKPWIRYEGSIHEYLKNRKSGQKASMEYVSGINIYHTGYTPRIVKAKTKRNLAMLMERQRISGPQPLDDFHFADCYYALQEYEKAIPYARKAIGAAAQPVGQEMRPYLVLIQSMMLSHHDTIEIESVISKAQARFPQEAVFYFLAGEHHWAQQEYEKSVNAIQSGLELYDKHKSDKDEGSLASRLRPHMYEHLAEFCQMQGNTSEEAGYLLTILQLQRYNSKALRCLLMILKNGEPADLIELLNGIFDKKKDAAYLIDNLRKLQIYPVCLYYDCAAGGILREEERYLFGNHPEAAAAATMENLEQSYLFGCALWDTMDDETQAAFSVLLPERFRRAMQGDNTNIESLRLQRKIRRIQMRLLE